MKIYKTNAALGYKQFAFLVRLEKSKNGYNYLCIGTQNVNDGSYCAGKVVKDLEDYYLEDCDYKLIDSPLYGDYLFDYFISNYWAR